MASFDAEDSKKDGAARCVRACTLAACGFAEFNAADEPIRIAE
ncbi:MAG TPA: hypothetical protein VMN36_18345 [Verrucomicrobiales bacterium]|nr:hypothetical protein [Verrucomicrobiales bacterium]